MKLYQILISIFLLLCVLVSSAYSEKIDLTGRKVKVAVFELRPWLLIDDSTNKQVGGIIPTFHKMVGERLGLEIEIVPRPFIRMVGELKKGAVDYAIFFKLPDNPKTIPVTHIFTDKVIILSNKNVLIQKTPDLAGKKVAVARGVPFPPAFENFKGLKKLPTKDYAQGIRMIHDNRIDSVIGSHLTISYDMHVLGFSYDEFSPHHVIGRKQAWLQFSQKSKNKDLIPIIQKVTQQMIAEGVYSRLREKIGKGLPGSKHPLGLPGSAYSPKVSKTGLTEKVYAQVNH